MKFAVFEQKSVHIPGDERSRQCPGHGYPAYDHKYTEVTEFETEEELLTWIERRERLRSYNKNYKVVRFEELSLNKTVTFKLEGMSKS